MTVKTTDVQKAYNEYLNEKNRQATYSQNNKNEKEFYRHLYIFNWAIFLLSVFLGYKAYKLYKAGPPIWDSMSSMINTLSFGFLGKKQSDSQSSGFTEVQK